MRYIITALLMIFAVICNAQNKIPAHWVSGTHAGHDYADLGLPSGTLWATCNIGANAPEEYGDFFGAKLSQRIGLSQRIIYIIQGKLFKILDMVNFMNALILAGI